MRVLLITYYFPPSGGSGVQRPVKFAKYLPAFGWDVTVLTVDPKYAAFPDVDSRMVHEIPEKINVVRSRAWDPYNLYGKLQGKKKEDSIVLHMSDTEEPGVKDYLSRWIRANVFIPDARVGWYPYAVRAAMREHQVRPYDVIITTGPPHSAHLTGKRLAAKLDIPWLADFRDPWTGIFYRSEMPVSRLADRFEKRLELSVLKKADSVVAVSKKDQHDFEQLAGRRVEYIPNGFDPEDFPDVADARTDKFVLGYVGGLDETSNPERLWAALKEGAEEMPQLRVSITGRAEERVVEAVRSTGVSVSSHGYVSHAMAIRNMLDSSLLFFCVYKGADNRYLVPAKLYEYLASGLPIMGIGPVDGEASKILARTGAGRMFEYSDQAGMRAFVTEHYHAWRSGKPGRGASPESVKEFSRIALTERLSGVLSRLVENR